MIEQRPASTAVKILTQQFHEAKVKHANELAHIALEAANLDPQDGWRYNVDTATYERSLPDPHPEEHGHA